MVHCAEMIDAASALRCRGYKFCIKGESNIRQIKWTGGYKRSNYSWIYNPQGKKEKEKKKTPHFQEYFSHTGICKQFMFRDHRLSVKFVKEKKKN